MTEENLIRYETGFTAGGVKTLLRLEGACVFLSACAGYQQCGLSWKLFAMYFFLPDVSFLGYLAGPKVGAFTYNMAHSNLTLTCTIAALWLAGMSSFAPWLLIWVAHIGFDRALGFGLKYASGFENTHLGKIKVPFQKKLNI